MCAASSSLLSRLRAETSALHEQVEAAIPILHPSATLSTYRTYLVALLAFHRPVEQHLARLDALRALPLNLEARLKTTALEEDLRTLAADPADAPACALAPRPRTLASALGCMYVLEGATLGGRVIHRHLTTRFPEVMSTSARYLHGYGGSTGEQWAAFCQVLAERPREEAPAIVDAAVEAFSRFGDWVQCWAHPRWASEGLTA